MALSKYANSPEYGPRTKVPTNAIPTKMGMTRNRYWMFLMIVSFKMVMVNFWVILWFNSTAIMSTATPVLKALSLRQVMKSEATDLPSTKDVADRRLAPLYLI